MTTQYKWLPREPTEEMLKAVDYFMNPVAKALYETMWQAASDNTAWVKFDVDDKSTWPPLDTIVMTDQGSPAALDDRYTWYLEGYALENQFVTHWTHLPVYRGE
jgi:hypothetical protein